MLKEVRRLKVGDYVMGTDGKPHRVTGIGHWTRGTRFIELDGVPDGAMFSDDLVEMAEAQRPQEKTA